MGCKKVTIYHEGSGTPFAPKIAIFIGPFFRRTEKGSIKRIFLVQTFVYPFNIIFTRKKNIENYIKHE